MIMSGLPLGSTRSVVSPSATLPDPAESALSEPERLLLSRIGPEPVSVEMLQQILEWSSSRISEMLTLLELEGLITQLPGARVCRGSV